jgi:thiamine pyrophosphokinase
MRRCIVIGNGIIEDDLWYQSILRKDDIILCADGGADHAFRLGLLPQGIAGDLDSVSGDVLHCFRSQGVEIRRYPPAKDQVDTELALDWAFEFDPEEILLTGCTGDRLDHTFANVHLLLRGADRGVRVRLVNKVQDVLLVVPGLPAWLDIPAGTVVSLLPLSNQVSGVELENLEYTVAGGVLISGSTLGISNVAKASPVRVKTSDGSLLVFVNHG